MGWEMKSIDKHISFISLIVNRSLRNSKEIATKDNTKNPKRGPKVWTEEEMKRVKQGDQDSPMLDLLLMDPANSPTTCK